MTKRGTYKGNATITLVGEFSDMTFGLVKARLILANLQAVERFVSDFTIKSRTKVSTPVVPIRPQTTTSAPTYIVKCDDCKAPIRTMATFQESVAGGQCAICTEKVKQVRGYNVAPVDSNEILDLSF